ncbi:hypothetical protein [Paenibacillus tianjinensis]|uniref:Uncharacterized protein n=1 Tax=Paenibacillus tianjinensis TaxID=2810347 RepID=A0ABX7L5U9_9BACL|nr:hypothetical protein [Paenibacillus tianjinensis]QSF43490.1 hypothetical protein JRJ22_19695 [Paenibacillus tianjinensis]
MKKVVFAASIKDSKGNNVLLNNLSSIRAAAKEQALNFCAKNNYEFIELFPCLQ